MLGRTPPNTSRPSRITSFQSPLQDPQTYTPPCTRGTRRHSHYPLVLFDGSPLSSRPAEDFFRSHPSTTATPDVVRGSVAHAYTCSPARMLSTAARLADTHNMSSHSDCNTFRVTGTRPLFAATPLVLEDVEDSQLFENTPPVVFGSTHASFPTSSIPVCSTPVLSKSPSSPCSSPTPSTPSQSTSLPSFDSLSCQDLVRFHRESLASRIRSGATSPLSRSHSYRPMPPDAAFFPFGPKRLGEMDKQLNSINVATPSTQRLSDPFTSPSLSVSDGSSSPPRPYQAPKSAPPISTSERKLRRQGVDFHSHVMYAKEFKLEDAADFEPDYAFRRSSDHNPSHSCPEVLAEDTQQDTDLDSASDYSYEAEDIDNGPEAAFDCLLGIGGDGMAAYSSDRTRSSRDLNSSPGLPESDVFSHPVAKDKTEYHHVSSSGSRTRPTLQITLPVILEPSFPSSPMDGNPYAYHCQEENELQTPLSHDGLRALDTTPWYDDFSLYEEDEPRSAFESDSDSCSNNEINNSNIRNRSGHRKHPGKFKRIKDALKVSVSMPSMRVKAKNLNGSREVTPSSLLSSSSYFASASSQMHTDAHTGSQISIQSSFGSPNRSIPSVSPFLANARIRTSRTTSGASLSPYTPPVQLTPLACSPPIQQVVLGGELEQGASCKTDTDNQITSTRSIPRPLPLPKIPLPPLPSISTLSHLHTLGGISPSASETPGIEACDDNSRGTVALQAQDSRVTIIDPDESMVLLEKSIAKLKAYRPTMSQTMVSSDRTIVPHEEQSCKMEADSMRRIEALEGMEKPTLDIPPSTLQRLDFLNLSTPELTPAEDVPSSRPSPSLESATLQTERKDYPPTETDVRPPSFFIPPFDFEKHYSSSSTRDSTLNSEKPIVAQHIRKSSSLFDINCSTMSVRSDRLSAVSNTSSQTSCTSSVSAYSPMSDESYFQSSSSSAATSPLYPKRTSSLRAKDIFVDTESISTTSDKSQKTTPRPFIYRPVRQECLSKSKPTSDVYLTRPTRDRGHSRGMPLLPEDEQAVIHVSVQRNEDQCQNVRERQSKIRKLFGRVGNKTEKNEKSVKGLRGSSSIRN
ncbi:unnamed protein product [Somion occarium]|uniref:Uncharacterized protein n=1 Tax=Somion occarium TaxID=3059160 RepID=A0ABP1DI51_9APHY